MRHPLFSSNFMNSTIPKYLAFDIDNTLVFGVEADVFYEKYKRALEITFAREMKISLEQAQKCLNAYRRAYDGQGELAFDSFGISQTCVYDAFCTVNPSGSHEVHTRCARMTSWFTTK